MTITCKTGSLHYRPGQEIRTDSGSVEEGSFSQRCKQVWKEIEKEEQQRRLGAKKLISNYVMLFSWVHDFMEMADGMAKANQPVAESFMAAADQYKKNADTLKNMVSKAQAQVKVAHEIAFHSAINAALSCSIKNYVDSTKIAEEMIQAAEGCLNALNDRKWANYIFTAKKLTDQAELCPKDQALAIRAQTARSLIDEKLNKKKDVAQALDILKSRPYILTDDQILRVKNGIFNRNAQILAARDLAYKKSSYNNLTIEEIRAQLQEGFIK